MEARFSYGRAGALGLALTAIVGGSAGASAQVAAVQPLKTTPAGRPLELTFSDDFKAFRPWTGTAGIWRTTFGDGSQRGLDRRSLPNNGELELYVDHSIDGLNPFSVDDHGLNITAEPTPPQVRAKIGNYPYVSGLITTQPSFAQTYGYFEMRAELPQGKGLWPAFWLLPQDQRWPPEIDIVESIGDSSHVYMTAHSDMTKAPGLEAHIAPSAFHVFAVNWDPQWLTWYLDGVEAGKQPTPSDMQKPMYILANLAVGGNWPGAPDATTHFPARLAIDYIRAYRFLP